MEYKFKTQSLLNNTRHELSSFAKLQQFSSVAERESYPSSLPYSDSDPEAAAAADTDVTSTTIVDTFSTGGRRKSTLGFTQYYGKDQDRDQDLYVDKLL
ncbi:hypothetical protein J6590_051824 [Homalodisca vitripennis]|nr:hypothetical protein J6590_051824 [Homalodisca vitripennis]